MVYLIVARTAADGNNIKTDVTDDAISLNVAICGKGQRVYFLIIYSQLTRNESSQLSGLDLNEHDEVATFLDNDVNVAMPHAPVLCKNGITLFAQMVGSSLLAPFA